jgi:hypothetical protein
MQNMNFYAKCIKNPGVNGRRDFIKKSASGFIASLATPAIMACADANKEKRDCLGVAFVGLGYYSTQILAPSIQMCKIATWRVL